MLIVLIGTAVGVIAASASTRLLGGFLYGVRPTDPGTFALVSLVLYAGAALLLDGHEVCGRWFSR